MPDILAFDPDRLADAAARAAIRGSLLFHLDLAGTLALGATGDLPVGGWAVEVGERGYEVLLLDAELDRELALVTFAADGAPLVAPRKGSPLPAARAAACAGRTLAMAFGSAGGATVVVPRARDAASDASIEGYWLRTDAVPGNVVEGRHWRAVLSVDGRELVSRTALSRGDLVIPGARDVPAEGLVLTDLDGAVPNETHVYLSLKHGIGIEVVAMASGTRWAVSGETIRMAGRV